MFHINLIKTNINKNKNTASFDAIISKACQTVFKKIAFYEKKGKIKDMLDGPVKQMGFKRLT